MDALKKSSIFKLIKTVESAPENMAVPAAEKAEESSKLKPVGQKVEGSGFDGNTAAAKEVPVGSQGPVAGTQSPMNTRLGATSNPQEVLNNLTEGMKDLKANLTPEDLPLWMNDDIKSTMIERVKSLDISPSMNGLQFGVSVDLGKLEYGEALLKPMGLLPKDDQIRLGHLMVLHEVFHSFQGAITDATYAGVGRAEFGLETVDFRASAVALETGVRWELREEATPGSAPSGRDVSAKTLKWLDAQRMGTKAFDQAEQGPRLEVLPDRRLRRYMIWGLQRSRARSLGGLKDLSTLLAEAPKVEMTFTGGHLDARGQKIVEKPIEGPNGEKSEIWVTANDTMHRFAENQTFQPTTILDAIRDFDFEALDHSMDYIVDTQKAALAPWFGPAAFSSPITMGGK